MTTVVERVRREQTRARYPDAEGYVEEVHARVIAAVREKGR